jgi:hypothetical protein
MDPFSAIQNAYALAKTILQKLEQAKRNKSTVAALADDVAGGQRQLLEVQDMARRNSRVLTAIDGAVRGLHELLVEIRLLADSISAASLLKRLWNGGEDEQKINDLRVKLKGQLQLLMSAANLKVGVHNANVLDELQREQQRAAEQQQRAVQLLEQILIALQRNPSLTLADLPAAGLSKLQEAARNRMQQGCSAAEAQVCARRLKGCCNADWFRRALCLSQLVLSDLL